MILQVEFGKYAFMPGKLVHTNELMVHLGDAYFASMTCKQALKIIQLRSTNLENTLTDLEKVSSNITQKADYLGKMDQEAQKDLFEIREECSESYKHPKDRQRVSRVKGSAAAETAPKNVSAKAHDSLMTRLQELQRFEDEEDQLERLSEHLDDTSTQQPIEAGSTSHEATTSTSSIRSNVSKSHPKSVKKVHFEDHLDDNETPTIRFRHSHVKPKPINDMTPGDIREMVKNPKTACKEWQPPTKAVAISDIIFERPTTVTQDKFKATGDSKLVSKFSGSKPVSKFKASRMKQGD